MDDESPRPCTLLVLSQVFVPDPASVGQHMADVARAMARRHWRVVVLTANRGYDNPSVKFPAHERLDGVEIRRLPLSSFGKTSIAIRLLAGTLFMSMCIVRGLFVRHLSAVLVTTSPPMCSVAAMIIGAIRRVPIKYWVMDLNPDQMIELGRIKVTSPLARGFNLVNRLILRQATEVIALDRFMAERLNRKRDINAKLTVIPPWPHDTHLEAVAHDSNPFRRQHRLDGKFVVMYSGNHSLASPLTTILQAALQLRDDPRVVFAFIGGGLGKGEVDSTIAEHRPSNIISLPYLPLAEIRYSLSAADVHLVTMGDSMVGVIHPCKIYGAMAVARPILLLGPTRCHAAELIEGHRIGWTLRHGDVPAAEATIRAILATSSATLDDMGRRASDVVRSQLTQKLLCGRLCDVLERGALLEGSRRAALHHPTA